VDITTDIQSMTAFRNNNAEFMEHLKRTGRPLVLTVNGKAAAVVQDAEAYQRLRDLAAEASVEEAIRQGREEIAAGLGRPAGEVFGAIRAEFNIPR